MKYKKMYYIFLQISIASEVLPSAHCCVPNCVFIVSEQMQVNPNN